MKNGDFEKMGVDKSEKILKAKGFHVGHLKQIAIRLSPNQFDYVKKAAAKRNQSISFFVKNCVGFALENNYK